LILILIFLITFLFFLEISEAITPVKSAVPLLRVNTSDSPDSKPTSGLFYLLIFYLFVLIFFFLSFFLSFTSVPSPVPRDNFDSGSIRARTNSTGSDSKPGLHNFLYFLIFHFY